MLTADCCGFGVSLSLSCVGCRVLHRWPNGVEAELAKMVPLPNLVEDDWPTPSMPNEWPQVVIIQHFMLSDYLDVL